MNTVKKISVFICILIILLLVTACIQTAQNPQTVVPMGISTTTPGISEQSSYGNNSTSMPPSLKSLAIDPPKDKISVYKGFWMPRISYSGKYLNKTEPSPEPMDNITLLKQVDANLVLVGLDIYIDKNGNVSTSYPEKLIHQRVNSLVQQYYPNGIRLGLVPMCHYSREQIIMGIIPDKNKVPTGPAPSISPDLLNNPHYLDNYNNYVGNLAGIAEQYSMEMFSPMNEPDLILGSNYASKWGQDILPGVKQNYHGKILYKAALKNYSENLDTRGYDIIGVTTSPLSWTGSGVSLENYQGDLSRRVKIIKKWADRDNVSEVMFGEVFGPSGSFSDEDMATATGKIFQTGRDYQIHGYVFTDPNPKNTQFIGTKWFDEIARQFRQV